MADYGIRVINPNTGSVQIDQNFRGMEVLEVLTLVTTANPSTGLIGEVDYFTPNCSRAVVMHSREVWESPVLYMMVQAYPYLERSRKMYLVGGLYTHETLFCVNAPAGTTVTFLVFGYPSNRSEVLPGYGLVVRDSLGQVTFNSNQRYLNIVDIVQGSDFDVGLTRTYPSGRSYACAMIGWAGRSRARNATVGPGGAYINYEYDEWSIMAKINGNFLQTTTMQICNNYINEIIHQWPGNHDYSQRPYTILVADITNFL